MQTRETGQKSRNPTIKNADETIKTRFQNEFDPKSEYNIKNKLTKEIVENKLIGSRTKVGWKCSIHNETWEQKIKYWAKNGIKCSKCKQERRAKKSSNPTIKNADETIKTRFQNEFDPKSEYNIKNKLTKEIVENKLIGSHTKVGWKCSIHNETWEQKIVHWAKNGIKCSKCKQERRAKKSSNPTIKNADETIKTRFQNEFDPESEYNIKNKLTKEIVENKLIGSDTKVGWKCSIHNETWEQMIKELGEN